MSEDQYRAILQATGTPNLEKGIEGFRRETAPLQQQQLDMAGTYSDPLDNLQEKMQMQKSANLISTPTSIEEAREHLDMTKQNVVVNETRSQD